MTQVKRKMSTNYVNVPIGIRYLQRLTGPELHPNRNLRYKFSVLILSYVAYTCYHMTRKPISVVKSVLHRNCTQLEMPEHIKLALRGEDDPTWCDYPPFDGPDSATLLGTLDTSFLISYGVTMFASGFVAERVSLRYFLTFGMLFSAIFAYGFGLAKIYDIHSMWYFIAVQALAGICQTTGWPGVVTLVGRWFGRSKRGLIFGIWNSHTSLGNILGTLIAAYYVETNWANSFMVPAMIMGCVGFIMFLFLVDTPELVGCQDQEGVSSVSTRRTSTTSNCKYRSVEGGLDQSPDDDSPTEPSNLRAENDLVNVVTQEISHRPTERSPMIDTTRGNSSEASLSTTSGHTAIGFTDALCIPGVIEFSLCLFFAKLVSYTFMFWLPKYIESSTTLGAEKSADLSTVFDVGGVIGAIAAGWISDHSGMAACTCASMLILAVPMLLIYQTFGALSIYLNGGLLVVLGILVNGPYALITTSVSAELGTHSSLEGNSKALATVTAIIDGTGSLGAAVGPFAAGFFSGYGWEKVFYMLMFSDVMALVLLVGLVINELARFRRDRRDPRID